MAGLIPFHYGGAEYLAPASDRFPLLLSSRLAAPAAGETPDVLVWDDLVLRFSLRKARWKLSRLRWPGGTSWLRDYPAEGRYALRADRQEEGLEGVLREPSRRVGRAEGILRWVGRHHRAAFAPRETDGFAGRGAGPCSLIVNYRNRSELMEKFLRSLERQVFESPLEILFVNNQSTSEEREKVVRQAKRLPTDRFSSLHLNYDRPFNHSAQCNLAALQAKHDTLVMANNDVELIEAHSLARLVSLAQVPGVASVGPRFVGRLGRLVSAGMEVYPDSSLPHGYGVRESRVKFFSGGERETIGNSFALTAMARESFRQLGGLDESDFPVEYNDVDFALRARGRGYRHLLAGEVVAFHEPGASRRTDAEKVAERHRSIGRRYPHLGTALGVDPHVQDVELSDLTDFPAVAAHLPSDCAWWNRGCERALDLLPRNVKHGMAVWLERGHHV